MMMGIQITLMDEVVHVLLNQTGHEAQTVLQYDNSVGMAFKKVLKHVMITIQTMEMGEVACEQ